jgi:hypothetical protein
MFAVTDCADALTSSLRLRRRHTGEWRNSSATLHLGTGCSFVPWPLYPSKMDPEPLYTRLGVLQNQSGRRGDVKWHEYFRFMWRQGTWLSTGGKTRVRGNTKRATCSCHPSGHVHVPIHSCLHTVYEILPSVSVPPPFLTFPLSTLPVPYERKVGD